MECKPCVTLRERKYAKTKKAILDIFIAKLNKQQMEDISIKEICDEIQISEGTFFNYFPKKTDILVYYIALWSIEVTWKAQEKEKQGSSLLAIEEIYNHTADVAQKLAPILFEAIAYIAKQKKILEFDEISKAEHLTVFSNLKGIEDVPAGNIVSITRSFLERAIKTGELPKNTNIDFAQLALRTIFFGTAMALSQSHVDKLKIAYQKNIKILWNSLKSFQDRADKQK